MGVLRMKGIWDIHNHILPGVDDGASTYEETYQMVAEAYRQGVRGIIFTPHHRAGMFEVSRKEQIQVFQETVAELRAEFPDMFFCLGCEYYIHQDAVATLDVAAYRIAATKAVLVEFSTRKSFATMREAVARIVASGYTPIIAHCERYRCLVDAPERVGILKQIGAKIQLNADSVLMNTGPVARYCKQLLTENQVDFIASDAHDSKHRGIKLADSYRMVEKRYGKGLAEQIFAKNPKSLFPKAFFEPTNH